MGDNNRMKAMTVTLVTIGALIAALAFFSSSGAGQPIVSRCENCGKLLGKETPDTELSADPEFKSYGMFQVCQTCMDKKMDRNVQATYTQVARKYKWNSIAHNKSLVNKSGYVAAVGSRPTTAAAPKKLPVKEVLP